MLILTRTFLSVSQMTHDGWTIWFLSECCNILSLFCWQKRGSFIFSFFIFCLKWFKFLMRDHLLCLLWLLKRLSTPGEYCCVEWCCVLFWSCGPFFLSFLFLRLWHAAVSPRHSLTGSLRRCFSRRFSCTFSRRPQAPLTTNGWSYKRSLEYVQVCVHFLKENTSLLLLCNC